MVYTLRFFFSSECSLFHNSNIFGSCIIHILYTGCAEIKKNNSGAKRLKRSCRATDHLLPTSADFKSEELYYLSPYNFMTRCFIMRRNNAFLASNRHLIIRKHFDLELLQKYKKNSHELSPGMRKDLSTYWTIHV